MAGIAAINAIVFGGRYGLNVAAGDLESDGRDEIVCGGGPDPSQGSRMAAFDAGAGPLAPIAALDQDVYGLAYGLRVATGAVGY